MPVVNGTTYNDDTPPAVIAHLEQCRRAYRQYRLRCYYGNGKTGKAWGDIPTGYVGRSAGSVKIPLHIANRRSSGGPGIADHCIVRLEYANRKQGGLLWQHPTFTPYQRDRSPAEEV